MKPFRFTPILKSLIWGGDKIASYKGIETSMPNIGESWELRASQATSRSCPYFVTSLYDLDAPVEKELSQMDSFLVVMCLAGRGVLVDDEGAETPIRQGETLLVPAATRCIRFSPDEKIKILTSHIG